MLDTAAMMALWMVTCTMGGRAIVFVDVSKPCEIGTSRGILSIVALSLRLNGGPRIDADSWCYVNNNHRRGCFPTARFL